MDPREEGSGFYWQVQETLKAAHMTPPCEGNRGLRWHLGEKTRVTSESACFSAETPLNFISHYISNVITCWNVTPAEVPGCRRLSPGLWKETCELTAWVASTAVLPWKGSVNLPASARKPRPAFINASSWAAAMSCQAALSLRLPERPPSPPRVASRSGTATHTPPFSGQPGGWNQNEPSALMWTMGTPPALNPSCPPLEIN